ncbi:hypothetical protein, conserved [Entamoeba histolytica]
MQEEFKERTKGWEEDIQAIETEMKSRNPIKELQKKRCKMAKIINKTEKERKTQEENKEETKTKNEKENYKEKEEIKVLQKQIKKLEEEIKEYQAKRKEEE